jgi:hypothetical protein
MDKDELRLESELDELRLKIAKIKGWKFGGIDNREESNYWVKEPSGYFVVNYCSTPEEAWVEAKEEYIPDWPDYISEAFSLLDEVEAAGLRWMLYTLADGIKNCAINKPVMIEDEEHWQLVAEEQAATAAVAICLAYASWMEGEKEAK